MKKIIALSIISMFSFLPVYALGINIGVSGSTAVFHGTGEDNENGEIAREDATGVAAYGSVFVEKTLGDRLTIGVNYVPDALESETAQTAVDDKTTSDTSTVKTNSVQIDFENLLTTYVALNLTDNMYVKAGIVTVDVITNESLATGSTYGDANMDGSMVGIGYNMSMDNGVFVRLEGNYMDMGSESVTASNSENKVSLKDLVGANATISIGKSF